MARKPSKLDIWLFHYLDQGTDTFLNAAESAKAAGYKCKDDNFKKQGYQNRVKCEGKILKWLDEAGLSDSALNTKLLQLLEAPSHQIQIKALDMGFKMKGLYAPEKRDVNVDLKDKEAKEAITGFFAGIMGVPSDHPEGD